MTERAYADYYKPLFASMPANPNGCPASATFYVSHQWTNYRVVQELYRQGAVAAVVDGCHRKTLGDSLALPLAACCGPAYSQTTRKHCSSCLFACRA